MKKISHTAQWTAAARAIETKRQDALFNDFLAETLAYPDGFDILQDFQGAGLIEFVAIRTKFIDEFIKTCTLQNNIKQIVMLASGMDTRAFRLNWPSDCVLFELDYEELQLEKNLRLNQVSAISNVTRKTVYTDLNDDWKLELTKQGFNANLPTLWIVEALLFFLTKDHVEKLLQTMSMMSANGSYLTTDMLNEQLLQHRGTQLFLKKLSHYNIPWIFGSDEPEFFLRKNGWQTLEVKEPGEDGANWGRWPYPVYPKDIKNIPRNWLINAKLAI